MASPDRVALAFDEHDLGPSSHANPGCRDRAVHANGKFLFSGGKKFYVRGVTYGTFGAGPDGVWPEPARVHADFALMAETGVNTVRTYTPPPLWLLDAFSLSGSQADS